jgi:hypothetical protein
MSSNQNVAVKLIDPILIEIKCPYLIMKKCGIADELHTYCEAKEARIYSEFLAPCYCLLFAECQAYRNAIVAKKEMEKQ